LEGIECSGEQILAELVAFNENYKKLAETAAFKLFNVILIY
jgi:hypothetical protein